MTMALTVRAKPEELMRVQAIVDEASAIGGNGDGGHFGRAFRMASAIRALHRAISDDMMNDIMALQGTGLGFLTDKDDPAKNNPPGYPLVEVKLVAIEAALMGAYWVGNEFNIIANRPYLTKNFFTRKLREFPGLTDLKLFPGVPALVGDKGALVPYVATWKLNGEEMRIERLLEKLDDKRDLDGRICVRVNSGMGADAILGKAERKIKAAIWARLTGSDFTDGEVEDVIAKTKSAQNMDELADKLTGVNGGHNQEPTEIDADLRDFATLELAAIDTIGDVEAMRATLNRKAKTEADKGMIQGLCNQRAEALRAKRK